MQAIPGIRVYAPLDGHDLERVINEVVEIEGPTYVRLSRFPSPTFSARPADAGERVAEATVLREGADLQVFTTGTLAAKVLEAGERLASGGLSARIVGVTRIKPLGPSIARMVAERPATPIAVVEEHNIHGGLADALSCLLDEAGIAHRIARIGIPDRFGESGPPEALLEAFGLAGEPLAEGLRRAARR
jgi:transketolase